MHLSLSLSIVLLAIGLGFCRITFATTAGNSMLYENLNDTSTSCPLNFQILRKLIMESNKRPALIDTGTHCHSILQGIRLVRSEYLRTHGYFLPPPISSHACWASYRTLHSELIRDFDIQTSCEYHPQWISEACMNARSKSDFENLIPEPKLQEVNRHCNQSLGKDFQCSICTESLLSLRGYLRDPQMGNNFSDCDGYPFMYAAAFVNPLGPTDLATVQCLFTLKFSSSWVVPSNRRHVMAISGAVMGCVIGVFGAVVTVWFLKIRNKKWVVKKTTVQIETSSVSGLGISGGANLVKYKYEEIKGATKNFSRQNIIGNGKYGNVYKGIFQDGSEVAVKRFKNCSISDDGTFAHEVAVIASVKHFNLVSLRGYCTATVPLQGHQRMIVCDLMPSGSLHDHLHGSESEEKRLSWPIRQKIALGTARGLAYLHYGAQSAIIHRDIKASNILLDESFEPKIADFGLAMFNPKGMSHLSTRLAGTLGYVAPEYALYGKLTEGSDVYSFGVVLLELLSGKKALLSMGEEKTSLLTDWAWSSVIEGRALDVIEEKMPEVGPPEVMEQYVFVAVLCCHSYLHARPTMDDIVKLLETKV